MSTLITLLTGGGLVGGFMYLANWQTSRNASQRDKATHAHELRMAQEARRQDRLEKAYTELGLYLSRYGDWARSVHPFMGKFAPPDPLPPAERWHVETLVTNHGSPEVRQLLERWTETARKIDNADAVIRLADQARGDGLDEEARRERLALEDHRKAMYEAADRIRDRMWAELNGQARAALERGAPAVT